MDTLVAIDDNIIFLQYQVPLESTIQHKIIESLISQFFCPPFEIELSTISFAQNNA